MTGGVPATVVEPLLSGGAVAWRTSAVRVACEDLARVQYVTCPYPPGPGSSSRPRAPGSRAQWI